MKTQSLLLMLLATILGAHTPANANNPSMKQLHHVDFARVHINDAFWGPRLEKHRTATLPTCIDQIENKTGRMHNFVNAAKHSGKHSGIFFDDSDVYKALEGIAYALANHPDKQLEAKADEWIDKIAAAQQPDGYINTFYTLTGLQNRWTNMDHHEMYCAGHLIEAGVAYLQATGKRKLLNVGQRMADHMMSFLGVGKGHWVPGHEEIELALVKLYGVTGQQRYLDFANFLLEQRGHGYGSTGKARQWKPIYYQDEMPVREMSVINGHAVRAMYLYCGMADVAALKNDTGYVNAMNRLWNNVTQRKMYITGGIGSSAHNEGFTADFDLPNKEAYCETCASVGMVYWNERMNELTGDAKYVDILERSMYNGALAGVSLSGDRFFYVNPLESDGNHHRQAWYGCACCPSQISRFLPSIGNYIYALSDHALWVNLFIGNEATVKVNGADVKLSITTGYPWTGRAVITVSSAQPLPEELRIRIPGWCKSYKLTAAGREVSKLDKGYAVIATRGARSIKAELSMAMPVELDKADDRVSQDVGKRAVQRGPLVYCMEQTDNKVSYDEASLPATPKFKESYKKNLLGGIVELKTGSGNKAITLIPYYAWDNREAGKMRVWIDYNK